MDTALSLLHALAATLVGFLITLGSFFGPHVVVDNPEPLATTTSQQVLNANGATTTPTQLPDKKSSGLPSEPSVSREGSAGQTFSPGVASPSKGDSAETPSAKPTPTAPTFSTEELNAKARASLVNILCTTAAGGSFNPISGSGVIIDSRGIILTNAHVAQYFLLRDYPIANNVTCVVRTGSPAQPRYKAELMYLPPSWIAANAAKISSSTPTGTGQNDFAFLRIIGTTNPSASLPDSFPALPMESGDPDTGNPMLLAAYPAGFLGGVSITLNLYITSAVATVGQLYDFSGDNSNVDLMSLGGTVVSQAGSSGGAVVNTEGKLNGIIVTEVPAATTAGRDLRAITIGHIDRSLIAEGQNGILGLLAHDPATFAAAFNAALAPKEAKALEDVLDKN